MLPAFCEKCGTMHGKDRPCDPKGLKSVKARSGSTSLQPEHGSAIINNAEKNTPLGKKEPDMENAGGGLSEPSNEQSGHRGGAASIRVGECGPESLHSARQDSGTRDFNGTLPGSFPPPPPTIHNATIGNHGGGQQLSDNAFKDTSSEGRDSSERMRALSGEGCMEREASCSQAGSYKRKAAGPSPEEPPAAVSELRFSAGDILREKQSDLAPRTAFDRTSYQRDYMRDLPKAKAEGLTVKQWREKHKND